MPKQHVSVRSSHYKRKSRSVEISGTGRINDLLRIREQRFYWLERLLIVILIGVASLLLLWKEQYRHLPFALLPVTARWLVRRRRT